jgi:hypothetical protein
MPRPAHFFSDIEPLQFTVTAKAACPVSGNKPDHLVFVGRRENYALCQGLLRPVPPAHVGMNAVYPKRGVFFLMGAN